MNWLSAFFDTQQFAPHGQCLLWQPDLLILYTLSDGAIALAYFSIPLALAWFVMKRRDIAFRWVFVLFCVFIVACGTTHVFDVWTLWNPDYGLAGLVKAVTAVASVGTAVMLWDLMPKALALPGPAQLKSLNLLLEQELGEHRAARTTLQDMTEALERRVQERTAELEREIAQRRETEAELRKSREQFRHLFLSNPLPMWIYDRDTLRFLEVNDAAVENYGYSREEFLAMTLTDIRPPEEVDRLMGVLRKDAAPYEQSSNWRHRRKNGDIISVDVFTHQIAIEGHNARLAVVQDVTQRNHAEEQLRQAQKMEAIGQLTGGIAHDFNNLLAIIQGNIELVQERVKGDPKLAEMIDYALRASERGASLTKRLLAYSRQQPLAPKPVDIAVLIAGMTDLLRRALGETIEVRTHMAPGLWQTRIDPNELEHAMLNLAVNARDAMPNGGALSIEAENTHLDAAYAEHNIEVKPGPYVMIAITDTGSGMSKEVIERVFEPFFTTKPVGQGSGLGLSMVYGFVKQSGGHIKLYSEAGHGTTIKLYLPRILEHQEAEPAAGDAAFAAAGPRKEVVLVVEDDPDVRKLVLGMVESLGYRTIAAIDGPDALDALARAGKVDLLFTDVVLPRGMNGAALAKAAQAQQADLKVLYMSGYTRNAILHNGALDEGVQLLTKPFRKADLAAKLHEVLSG
ncbi:hybrid sensor histidine kinase/response regulator [Dongia sedimenti]|uniref:histidine kinase n=1 Tax=Dongia sedimenti TaxID=3064282 RepID=A0ABU0YLP8_9PROT|nr:ATP-binding protein [Rhodospirillaceae bacterium R-7]